MFRLQVNNLLFKVNKKILKKNNLTFNAKVTLCAQNSQFIKITNAKNLINLILSNF